MSPLRVTRKLGAIVLSWFPCIATLSKENSPNRCVVGLTVITLNRRQSRGGDMTVELAPLR